MPRAYLPLSSYYVDEQQYSRLARRSRSTDQQTNIRIDDRAEVMESTATTTDTLRDEETAKSNTAYAGIVPPNAIVEPTTEVPASSSSKKDKDGVENTKRGFQFWAIIVALCIVGLLAALENTVVTTSLPTIVNDLSIGDNYIWITNIFFLTR